RGVIDVPLQIVMEIVDLAGAAREPLPRIPTGVKFSRRKDRFQSLRHWQSGVENCAAHFQMRIEGFARDEQTHDFTRTFEDRVDATIAQETLNRNRFFAATGERLRRFVTAPAAYLQRVVLDFPVRFGRPTFAPRG